MTNREWLNRSYNLEKYIKELKTAYNSAYENAVYVSPTFAERVQKGESNSSEAKLSKCVDLLCQIEKLIDTQYEIKQEIISAISELQDSRYRVVLVARYVNFKKLSQIAQQQNYSERQVIRILKEAEENIKDVT